MARCDPEFRGVRTQYPGALQMIVRGNRILREIGFSGIAKFIHDHLFVGRLFDAWLQERARWNVLEWAPVGINKCDFRIINPPTRPRSFRRWNANQHARMRDAVQRHLQFVSRAGLGCLYSGRHQVVD